MRFHLAVVVVLGMLFLAAASPMAVAAKDRAWQDGILKDVSRTTENQNGAFGGNEKTVLFSYTIEAGDRFYVAARAATFAGQPPVDADINSPIKIAVDGKDVYVQDKKGKEYRLRIIKQGLKNPS